MKHIHTLPPILLIGLLLTLSSLPTVQAATNCAAVTEIPQAQCDTLLALYNSTGGANWTNKTGWNETNTPCSWYGISCSGGNVTDLSPYGNNLTGSLPSLSALTGLQILDVGWNQLTGTIPDLSKLTSLQSLFLNANQLTGTIPDLSQLTSLRELYLAGNQLTGTIPDLSKLTSLQDIFLGGNQLTGTIPDLSKLTNLRNIDMGDNQLIGIIPDLSNLISLRELDLSNNQLTGTIPDLSKTNLNYVVLNNNQLSGPIPSLGTLPLSKQLNLSNNPQLCKDPNANYGGRTEVDSFPTCPVLTINKTGTGTGEVKTADAKINCGPTCQSSYMLNDTVTLTVAAIDSSFTGWSGACTGTATNINVTMDESKICTANFDKMPFSCNNVTEIPKAQCDTLVALYDSTGGDNWTTKTGWKKTNTPCSWYGITCGMPCWYGISCEDSGSITAIRLSNNNLTGSLPDLSALPHFNYLFDEPVVLDLSYNQLTGPLPDNLNVGALNLSHNQFTGEVPDWFSSCAGTDWYDGYCNLSDNQLRGTFPSIEVNNYGDHYSFFSLDNNPLLCVDTTLRGTCGDNENYGGHYYYLYCPNGVPDCSFLTITKTGTGTGEVKTTEAIINCGTTCQGIYPLNSTVTLTATPATDFSFTGWSGGCTGTTPTIALTIDAASKTCTATFDKMFPLTINKKGTGTGQIRTIDAKLDCGTTCQSEFSLNSTVTLIVIAANGSTFTGWTGDCTGTDTSITLTMNAAKTCTASFATVPTDTTISCPTTTPTPVVTLPVTLTLTKMGTGTVEVKTADTTLNCNPTCQADYTQNSTVTLTATPATDFTFTGWGGGCTGTNPEITVTMDTAKICLAHFDTFPPINPPTNGTDDTFCNQVLEIPKAQCQTLVTLYDHTNGSTWTHQDGWQTTPTPCTWTGITCTNGNVTGINLTGNNLLGTFPDLTLLTQMQSLQLSNNLLTGTMPTYLKDLTQLRTLTLDHNPDLCRDHNLDYGSLTGIYAVSQCLTHQLPIAAFKVSTLTGPAPLPVTLDATVSTVDGSISNYQWETSDGQTLTGATPSLTYNHSGTYTITLKVTDNQGATSTNVAKQTITVTSTQPTLTVRKTGNGRGQLRVRVDKQDTTICKTADPCPENGLDYPVGTAIKLTASTIEGVIFKGWNGDCGGTATTVTLTMDSNKTCIADFELDNTAQNRYTFTVQAIGTGQGTIEGAGINCGEDCTDNYKPGKPLWLKAVPEIDSIFGGWSGDCAGQTKQSIELVMNSNKTCQVTFNSRDITMSYLGVDNLIENAELDTGEEIYNRYPRYPFNDERLQEALWLAEPVLTLVDRQINWADLNSSWPRQLNGIDQGLKGAYTESVKVMEDAEIQGFLAKVKIDGHYLEVRVKLLNRLMIEEMVPILIYWGEEPTTVPTLRYWQAGGYACWAR